MPSAEGMRLGTYAVIPPLGLGGRGEVYLASADIRLHSKVALKILPADLASDRNRMRRLTG